MKVPFSSIRVGPYDVLIKQIPDSEAANLYGDFSEADMTIRIKPTISSSQLVAETAIHEILHCLWAVMHLPNSGRDIEERAVGGLGTGLAQVIRDNPKLIDWLQRALRSK
jgi:hypothetical protein